MSINEITSVGLSELLEKECDVMIIDVRESEEVVNGMIEGAKHIPLGNIPRSMGDLDKNIHYVLVCRSGARSLDAARYLQKFGYNVSNLIGGMLEWKGEIII